MSARYVTVHEPANCTRCHEPLPIERHGNTVMHPLCRVGALRERNRAGSSGATAQSVQGQPKGHQRVVSVARRATLSECQMLISSSSLPK